jgi:hypothetical protein
MVGNPVPKEVEGAASRPPPFARLLLRGALAVRRVRVLTSGLRVALRLRRFFVTLGMVAFAVMLGSSPMALRGRFVMLRSLGMSFSSHSNCPWLSFDTY